MKGTRITQSVNLHQLFSQLFSPQELINVFQLKFSQSPAKGVDRLNGFQFSTRAIDELSRASEKCLAGTYRFSPYLEKLITKGRGKSPRLIAIPVIRDRIVLHQINKFLAEAFPGSIPRNVANGYVRTIAEELATRDPYQTFICGSDIKSFYDVLERDRLLAVLSKRIDSPMAVGLIRHALATPIVPKNVRRSQYSSFKTAKGVPQGLAVSNILAAIYLAEVDEAMKQFGLRYFRYVDDVLMYGDETTVKKAHRSLSARLRRRGLALHAVGSGKSHIGPLVEHFGYLGYSFQWPIITVRSATAERLLQSIAAKFSEYRHNKTRRLEKFKYLTEARLAEIFLLELNERISGAVSEQRRYGWIAYFSQINDMSLLYHLDSAVRQLFSRLSDFGGKPPPGLKSFSRAYFEMKFNASGGYVHNYDKMLIPVAKLAFLVQRGRVGPNEALTNEQIESRYDRYRKHILSAMHADEQLSYG